MPVTSAEIGIARRDISPPLGIRANSWPLSDWERSEGDHWPMTLTALAVVSDDGVTQLMIAIDGTWWGRVADEWNVRGRVLEQLGLSPDQLLINLSHTHSGPLLISTFADKPGGEHILPYQRSLADAAIQAGREAIDGRVPGRIEWTVGRSSLAGNRELDFEGRPVVGYNPSGEPDDTVLIGRITKLDGALLGTLVNYACHPTTLAWQNRLISPDWVGAMRATIEQETWSPAIFVQGASGELAPREQYSGDTELADRHGRSVGHAVLAALNGMQPPGTELEFTGVAESGAPLAMWQSVERAPGPEAAVIRGALGSVEIELVDMPSMDELAERWKDIDPRSREERLSRARNVREDYITGPTVQYPVWVWRWGRALVVAHPGEAYSRLQLTLRERFPGRPIIVMNLTNGPGFVYLPTQDAYDRGAYQAWQTIFVAGSLDRLEDAATALIAELVEGGA